jgi:hypothetical protein
LTDNQATSPLKWADNVTATKTEAHLAHHIWTAINTTIPKNWQTLPNGKPTANTITAKTIRQLQKTQQQENQP